MRQRWLGMVLVALAIILAAPIALTMATQSRWYLSKDFNYPWTNQREIDNGVLVYGSGQTLSIGTPTSYPPPVRPFDFRWEQSGGVTSINLPVWPIPLAMAIIGGFLWRRGSNRSPRFVTDGRVSRKDRFAHGMRGLAIWLLIGTGVALASVTALSFHKPFETMSLHEATPSQVLQTHRTIERGGFGLWRFESFFGWARRPARPGPFTFQWKVDGETLDLLVPIWPLPILMLAIGGVALLRRERSLLAFRKGHCLKCGYDLVATPGPICPECGTRRT